MTRTQFISRRFARICVLLLSFVPSLILSETHDITKANHQPLVVVAAVLSLLVAATIMETALPMPKKPRRRTLK